MSVGHPRGTHSRYVIGCCVIPLGICGLKNNSRRITYGIGCVWGMPSLSPLSSLGFGNAVGKGRTFLLFQFTINNKCLIGRIHKSKFADSVLNLKPWHENWWMSLQLERKVAAFLPPSEQSKKYIENFLVDIHSLITGKKTTELVYNNI